MAKQIGVTTGGNLQDWIGTSAERIAFVTTGLGAGSSWQETDTVYIYEWTGAAWMKL